MAPEPARSDAPDEPASGSNVLVTSFVWLFAIGFGVWLVTAGKHYREQYTQYVDGFRLGSTRMVELTLVASDQQGLGCASDTVVEGLHCSHHADSREAGPLTPVDPQLLQPYYTTSKELLLGAGLWLTPAMKPPLPGGRFTVVCNYHVVGVTKAVAIRFAPTSAFGQVGGLVPMGTLSDCVFP